MLGCLFRVSTVPGAILGAFTGLCTTLWLSMGAIYIKPNYPKLNTTLTHCNSSYSYAASTSSQISFSFDQLKSHLGEPTNLHGFERVYALSFMWYPAVGFLSTVLVGLVISVLTGGLQNKPNKYCIFARSDDENTSDSKDVALVDASIQI